MFKQLAAAAALVAPLLFAAPAQATTCNFGGVSPSRAVMSEVQIRISATGRHLDPDGVAGPMTRRAIASWERSIGITPDGVMSTGSLRHLRKVTSGPFSVNVNKAQQKMYILYRGRAVTSNPVSTGSGRVYRSKNGSLSRAVTPSGTFRVFRSEPGWYSSRSLDGCLYKPLFFNRGIALHGSNSVPRYAASHGCVRMTPVRMEGILRTLKMGSVVRVS